MSSALERARDWVFELEDMEPPLSPPFDDASFPDDDESPAHGPDALPTCEAPTGCLTFVHRDGHYRPEKQVKLRNSLLLAVGFLEIANAGDFAANVWNEIPVPVYAIVLMAMGGTLALGALYFAAKDARLSWDNFRGLLAERRFLKAKRVQHGGDRYMVRTVDCFLDVNFREIGMELTERIGMDILMGFGALTIGIGTYLAIGDADPTIFRASNLLTGYIGNMPCALYGAINLVWSGYVWRRAGRRSAAARPKVQGTRTEQLLKNRTSSVRLHSALHAVTGAVAGAASIATSTMWWGYVVLGPCIITSALVNLFWRVRVGYDRPFIQHLTRMDQDTLLDALAYIDSCRQHFRISPTDPLSTILSNPRSVSQVVDFVTRNQLFEEFCARILEDQDLAINLFGALHGSITFDSRVLAATEDDALSRRLIGVAKAVVADAAARSLDYQERYLLEALGCYMYNIGEKEGKKGQGGKDKRRTSRNRNAHTDCGRHGNDWLFGGFSITERVARILKI